MRKDIWDLHNCCSYFDAYECKCKHNGKAEDNPETSISDINHNSQIAFRRSTKKDLCGDRFISKECAPYHGHKLYEFPNTIPKEKEDAIIRQQMIFERQQGLLGLGFRHGSSATPEQNQLFKWLMRIDEVSPTKTKKGNDRKRRDRFHVRIASCGDHIKPDAVSPDGKLKLGSHTFASPKSLWKLLEGDRKPPLQRSNPDLYQQKEQEHSIRLRLKEHSTQVKNLKKQIDETEMKQGEERKAYDKIISRIRYPTRIQFKKIQHELKQYIPPLDFEQLIPLLIKHGLHGLARDYLNILLLNVRNHKLPMQREEFIDQLMTPGPLKGKGMSLLTTVHSKKLKAKMITLSGHLYSLFDIATERHPILRQNVEKHVFRSRMSRRSVSILKGMGVPLRSVRQLKRHRKKEKCNYIQNINHIIAKDLMLSLNKDKENALDKIPVVYADDLTTIRTRNRNDANSSKKIELNLAVVAIDFLSCQTALAKSLGENWKTEDHKAMKLGFNPEFISSSTIDFL
jgi:hypothetical protein